MNHPNSRKMLSPIGNERGIAIVIALLVLVILSLFGTLFLTASLTESTISANEVDNAKAFWIAEAGVQHAMKSLADLNPSAVLDGTENVFQGTGKGKGGGGGGGLVGYGTKNLADGNYGVQVTNNTAANGFPRGTIPADPSASDTVDGDQIVVLTSTGTLQGAQKRIVAVVRVPGIFPAVPAGLTLVTNDLPVWDVDEADSTISGADEDNGNQDWSGTCPGVAGVVHSNNNINLNNNGIVHGVPGAVREYDPATDDPIWNDPQGVLDLVDQWMAQPGTVTYTGNNPPSLGTEDNPQITVWNPTSNTHPGELEGYGILILTDTFQFGPAEFSFNGLIIHRGGNVTEYTGGAEVNGGVVSVSTGATDGSVEDDSAIKYDCDALTKYAAPLGGGGGGPFEVLSWQEVAM